MKRSLKTILIAGIILITLPFASLWVISKIHHQSAHDEFVDFINHEFNGAVSFQNFSISYINHFPKVHIQLDGVAVKDSTREVLRIGKLDILLNTKSFWQKKIKLKDLIIQDADLFSEIDSLGNKTQLFPANSRESDSVHEALLIEANNIKILNSRLYFGNQIKGNRNYIQIHEAWLDLMSKDSLLVFNARLDGTIDSLISNNSTLFTNQPVKARDIVFNINRYTGVKNLSKGYIEANTLRLIPRFQMSPFEDGQMIELHLTGEDNFNSFLDVFEFHTELDLEQINPGARLALSYNQTGFANASLKPYSELDFEITEAEFTGSVLPYPLEINQIKGNYNNGLKHSAETMSLEIDTINADINESYIRGRFKLTNLNDPQVDAHIVAQLDMSHLIKENKDIRLAGSVDLDLILAGKVRELQKLHLEGKQIAKGEINVHNLELILNDQGYSIELLNGSSILNNHIIEVTTLIGTFNKSAFHFQGHLENLDKFIMEDNENLTGRFALNIDELDLTKLDFRNISENNHSQGSFSPLSLLTVEILVNAKKVITEMGDVEDLKLESKLENNKLTIAAMEFNYQEGSVMGSAAAIFGENGLTSINADLKGDFEQLDINLQKPAQKEDKITGKAFHFPDFITANLDFQVRNGSIDRVPLSNMILLASMDGNELSIKKLNIEAMDGKASVKGRFNIDSTGIDGIWMKATLDFNRLNIDSLINTFTSKNTSGVKDNKLNYPAQINVELTLRASEAVYKDAQITNLNTNLLATTEHIRINNFYMDMPFGNLSMDMMIKDYQDEEPFYSGSVDLLIDSLKIDEFLALKAFGIPDKDVSKEKIDKAKGLPEKINVQLKVKARHASYTNAEVQDLNLLVHYNQSKVELKQLKFLFAGGQVDVNGFVQHNKAKSYPGYLYSKVDSMDIDHFLNSFNDFNQDVFTSANTSGRISWASHYYFTLDDHLTPKLNNNFWILNFSVHQTELRQVKPIEDALFFVGHNAKDTMFIKQLDINALIVQDKIFFRDIFMNNNIANLEVFGQIDITEKLMNIGLEVSLSDLFFRSKKDRLAQTQQGIENLDNDAKIFLNMNGPLNDHKLSKSSKRKFNSYREDLFDEIKLAERDFQQKNKKN